MSKEMRRVLRQIWKHPWSTPKDCDCSYRTFVALERRGLIRVSTTFSSIAFPRTAEAVATSAGETALWK